MMKRKLNFLYVLVFCVTLSLSKRAEAQLRLVPYESDSTFFTVGNALKNPDRCAYIYLEYDSLTTLPKEFIQLNHLRGMLFKFCPVAKWDSVFITLSQVNSLEFVDISICKLKNIPSQISMMKNIRGISFSANQLTTLPSGLISCANLTFVRLSLNTQMDWNDAVSVLGKIPNLNSLDISNEQFFDLPEAICSMKEISELDLSNNNLTVIPAEFYEMDKITSLDLSNNLRLNFDDLFSHIGSFKNLQSLNLSGNDITEIPKSIGNIISLTELNLSGNQLTKLPSSIGNLTQLKVLNLGTDASGQRKNLIPKFPGFEKLVNIETLDLSGIPMNKMPDFIGKMTKLKELKMNWCAVTAISDVLRNCKQLERLCLNFSMISEIPEWIGELTELKELDLDANFFGWNVKKIISLPVSITDCKNLEILTLRDQLVKALPENFVSLTKLKRLDLRNNGLTSLPADFYKLESLKYLDLKANMLPGLPNSFSQIPKLTFLDISFNQGMNNEMLVNVLTKTSSLRMVDVSYLNMTAENISALQAGLPKTKIVCLSLYYLPTPGTSKDEQPKK